jgi:hypothetical protein
LPCTHDRSRRFENQNAHSVTGAARPLSTEPQPFDSAATERDSHGLHTAISPSAALLDATYTLLLSVIAFLNIVPNYSEKPSLCQTLFSTDLSNIYGVDLTFFAFCFTLENTIVPRQKQQLPVAGKNCKICVFFYKIGL